jgi:Arc/MetJ family transcription regulator
MHWVTIVMHMKTTLIIDDELLKRAQDLTGLAEKTAVLHAGLDALIERESARRLAALGGTERNIKTIRRRRPSVRR